MIGLIKIENLCYQYGDGILALNHLNLTISDGEFLVVLGRNGSGKSTLAKHLNALLLPLSGHVLVDGLDSSLKENTWPIRERVGMVFQNPDNQIISSVVEEDVAFGPENLGLPPEEIRKRVDEALRLVGMEDYAHFEPHRLSGGQKQRVAIAGALAMRSGCLVLDEPTAMLDPRGRAEVLEVLHRLNREEGLTVVLITHYPEEAAYASRVAVLDRGQVALHGTPREVFSKAKELRQLGLECPPVVQLVNKLRESGLPLPPGIYTTEELVEWLCASG